MAYNAVLFIAFISITPFQYNMTLLEIILAPALSLVYFVITRAR